MWALGGHVPPLFTNLNVKWSFSAYIVVIIALRVPLNAKSVAEPLGTGWHIRGEVSGVLAEGLLYLVFASLSLISISVATAFHAFFSRSGIL